MYGVKVKKHDKIAHVLFKQKHTFSGCLACKYLCCFYSYKVFFVEWVTDQYIHFLTKCLTNLIPFPIFRQSLLVTHLKLNGHRAIKSIKEAKETIYSVFQVGRGQTQQPLLRLTHKTQQPLLRLTHKTQQQQLCLTHKT